MLLLPMLRLLRRRAPNRLCAALSSEVRVSISESLILSFDTETTGIDTDESRVVELGACYFRGAARVGPRRRMLVNPGCDIPQEATAVHGIGDVTVASSPSFCEVGPKFVQHLIHGPDPSQPEPPLLLGYNAVGYDVPLLNAEFERHGIDYAIDAGRVLDPFLFLSWHRRSWPKRSLGATAEQFGYDLASKAHSACDDAEATAAVLRGCLETDVMPDDFEKALLEQSVIRFKLSQERNAFKHFLYVDRTAWGDVNLLNAADLPAELLRFGFGKHVGTPLQEMDAAYLGWCLEKVDLNDHARAAIQKQVN